MTLELTFTADEQAAWADLRARTTHNPGVAQAVPALLLRALDRELAPLNQQFAEELRRIRQRERCPSPEALSLRLDQGRNRF